MHLGFNQDEAGRRVFDGMNPNIAARQLAMNIRFAAPGGAAESQDRGATTGVGRSTPVVGRMPPEKLVAQAEKSNVLR